jgi:ribosomal protein S18 acetylase RimI-like enzyme
MNNGDRDGVSNGSCNQMTVMSGRDIVRMNAGQSSAALRTLERAFLDYPLMVYACPDPQQRSRGVRALYAAILRDASRYGEIYTSPGVEGIACWLPPGVALPTIVREIRAGLLGLPFSFGWKAFRCLLEYGHWHTKLHHEFTSSPHWFLATIGVDPAFQGKGIGGALLEAITIKADQQHVPCYLETHGEKSARLYERHGFETVRLFEVPGHSVPVWAMLRPARST